MSDFTFTVDDHYRGHLDPAGNVHTLVPGCEVCERMAAHPHTMGRDDLRCILAKFVHTGIQNGHARTNLDAQLATAVERARAICSVLGLLERDLTIQEAAMKMDVEIAALVNRQ